MIDVQVALSLQSNQENEKRETDFVVVQTPFSKFPFWVTMMLVTMKCWYVIEVCVETGHIINVLAKLKKQQLTTFIGA